MKENLEEKIKNIFKLNKLYLFKLILFIFFYYIRTKKFKNILIKKKLKLYKIMKNFDYI